MWKTCRVDQGTLSVGIETQLMKHTLLVEKIFSTSFEFVFIMIDMNLIFVVVVVAVFQITQQLEGICLQVIGTVLQQHVLGEQKRSTLYFHIPLTCCIRSV